MVLELKITGDKRQRKIYIPRKYWNHIDKKTRIIITNNKGQKTIRPILFINGKNEARVITILKCDWELFKIGDKIKINIEKQKE